MQNKHTIYSAFLLALTLLWAVLANTGVLAAFDYWGMFLFRTGEGAVPVGPSWLPEVILMATHVGDSAVLIILGLLLVGVVWHQAGRGLAFKYAGVMAGIFVLIPILKAFIARARPDVVEALTVAKSASFPSGHTLRSAIVLFLLAWFLKNKTDKNIYLIICYVFILITGISRIYLGVHWPSDVIGSWLIATTWLYFWLPKLKCN